jgi:hypothetical protein
LAAIDRRHAAHAPRRRPVRVFAGARRQLRRCGAGHRAQHHAASRGDHRWLRLRIAHDIPDLQSYLARNFEVDRDSVEPGKLATTLAGALKQVRPELDIYLLSDRAPELLAGSD